MKKAKTKKEKKNKRKVKEKGGRPKAKKVVITGITILKRWVLPEKLTEISGISYLDENLFACVQDETGIVFLYNTATGKIEKEIHFSSAGDFEGIAVAHDTIYVIRADGKLYSISSYDNRPVIKEFSTGLTLENNIESLCYDRKNNRLLLTGKNEDPGRPDKKLIYAFDINKGKMKKKPVMSIDLTDPVFNVKGSKRACGVLQPSAINIHPVTKDIYITDGPAAKLLVTDSSGSIISFIDLNDKDIPQAEGISFSPKGDVYISTEGKKKFGAILQVELTKN